MAQPNEYSLLQNREYFKGFVSLCGYESICRTHFWENDAPLSSESVSNIASSISMCPIIKEIGIDSSKMTEKDFMVLLNGIKTSKGGLNVISASLFSADKAFISAFLFDMFNRTNVRVFSFTVSFSVYFDLIKDENKTVNDLVSMASAVQDTDKVKITIYFDYLKNRHSVVKVYHRCLPTRVSFWYMDYIKGAEEKNHNISYQTYSVYDLEDSIYYIGENYEKAEELVLHDLPRDKEVPKLIQCLISKFKNIKRLSITGFAFDIINDEIVNTRMRNINKKIKFDI